MPTIRAIRPTDLVSLVAFFRHESPRDVTAHLWPEVGEKAPGRFLRSITSLLLARPGSSQLWLYLAGGIRALVVFQPRAGKLAWDVQELFLAGEDDGAGIELLEHIAGEAAGRGARKLFLATPVEDSAVRLAGKSGFANYTAESLYCLRGWPSTIPGPDLVGRLRLRRDTQGIFQLYNAAVPCRVRSAEAMTLRPSRTFASSSSRSPKASTIPDRAFDASKMEDAAAGNSRVRASARQSMKVT